jgi:hypothetical protein
VLAFILFLVQGEFSGENDVLAGLPKFVFIVEQYCSTAVVLMQYFSVQFLLVFCVRKKKLVGVFCDREVV